MSEERRVRGYPAIQGGASACGSCGEIRSKDAEHKCPVRVPAVMDDPPNNDN